VVAPTRGDDPARAPGDRKISSFLYASWEAQREDADEHAASIDLRRDRRLRQPASRGDLDIVTIRKIIRPIHRLMDATTQIAGVS
jgi:hypothetical protein